MTPDVAETIADNARIVIAIMHVPSVVVAGGVTMLDQPTSLDQFQTDADEADTNFSPGTENATRAQVIVEDEDVLYRETLVAMLDCEQSLRDNGTVNETLAANVVRQWYRDTLVAHSDEHDSRFFRPSHASADALCIRYIHRNQERSVTDSCTVFILPAVSS